MNNPTKPLVGAILLCGATGAQAGDFPYETQPYISPRVNVQTFAVTSGNSTLTSTHLLGGVEGGLLWRHKTASAPPLTGRLRGVGMARYGLNTGSIGPEVRTGLWGGPTWDLFLFHTGPDIWFNGYEGGAGDVNLAYSPGVDLHNEARLFPQEVVSIVGMAIPGWAFNPDRASEWYGPFHQVDLIAAAVIDTSTFGIALGIQRTYDSFGARNALVLSGGI